MKSNLTPYILPIFILGCGASKEMQAKLSTLERAERARSEENEKLRKSVSELSEHVMVLQDRLETIQLAMERNPETRSKPVPVTRLSSDKTSSVSTPEPEDSESQPFLFPANPKEAALPAIHLSNRDLESLDNKKAARPVEAPQQAAAPKNETSVPKDESTALYTQAFQKYESRQYGQAAKLFEQFAKEQPGHPYADNAVFWIGEIFFETRDYSRARAFYDRVAQQFPNGNKVPDALLKSALCYRELSNEKDAQASLKKLLKLYPNSMAAKEAQRLMASAGQGRK